MIFTNIKALAKDNSNFRHVIYTGKQGQLVLMSILPGSEIGEETHESSDQILFIVKGIGEAIVDGQTTGIAKHAVVFVPARTKHNIKNTGEEDLKLYTVYSSSTHPDGLIQKTKEEAQKGE